MRSLVDNGGAWNYHPCLHTKMHHGGLSTIADDKSLIRMKMRTMLKGLEATDPTEVERRIIGLDAYARASVLVGYCPMKDEVDVSKLLDRAVADGKTVLLPDIEPGTFRAAPSDWRERLIKLENGTKTVDTYEIISIVDSGIFNDVAVVVLVPGLAFTEDGTRLGRGSGYYDQFLNEASGGDITTIGICRGAQILESLPQQPHDRKVDMVIAF